MNHKADSNDSSSIITIATSQFTRQEINKQPTTGSYRLSIMVYNDHMWGMRAMIFNFQVD